MDVSATPIRPSAARPASRALAAVTAASLALAPGAAHAQALPKNAGIPLIRDAEIEQLLRDYTSPILRAANLSKQNIQVVLINDKTFTASVADARRIFVNIAPLMLA